MWGSGGEDYEGMEYLIEASANTEIIFIVPGSAGTTMLGNGLVTKQKFVVEDQNSMNEDIDSYDRRVVQQ
jgi:hypothetical protein